MNTSICKVLGCLAMGALILPGVVLAQPTDRYKVTFEVEGNSLQLKKNRFYTSRSNCRSRNHDGCFDVPEDHAAEFTLVLQQGDADCRQDSSWKFHSVVLGGESTVQDPAPKPDEWGGISEAAAADFGADASTGEVALTPDGKKKVTFRDANQHEFSIWYKVVVEHCGSGRTLAYDPRIDNRGSPGN